MSLSFKCYQGTNPIRIIGAIEICMIYSRTLHYKVLYRPASSTSVESDGLVEVEPSEILTITKLSNASHTKLWPGLSFWSVGWKLWRSSASLQVTNENTLAQEYLQVKQKVRKACEVSLGAPQSFRIPSIWSPTASNMRSSKSNICRTDIKTYLLEEGWPRIYPNHQTVRPDTEKHNETKRVESAIDKSRQFSLLKALTKIIRHCTVQSWWKSLFPWTGKLKRSCQNKDLSSSEHRVEASLPNESRGGLQPNHMVKSWQVWMLNRTLDQIDFEGFQAAFQAPWNLITMGQKCPRLVQRTSEFLSRFHFHVLSISEFLTNCFWRSIWRTYSRSSFSWRPWRWFKWKLFCPLLKVFRIKHSLSSERCTHTYVKMWNKKFRLHVMVSFQVLALKRQWSPARTQCANTRISASQSMVDQ